MASLSPRLRTIIDQNVPPHMREYMYRMVDKEGASGNDSPTGARGPLQFTKGTGRAYGLLGKDGDIRGDEVANIRAGVRLTEDNAAILRKHLNREPTHSELALAHQQGADTAGKMLTGRGNAPPENLRVNGVDPNAPPQEAASKIMNYYGFGDQQRRLGMTLNTLPVAPEQFRTPEASPAGSIPYIGAFQPAGTNLNMNPVEAAAAPTAAASLKDRLLGTDGMGGKGTPFADILGGLGDMAKGVVQKPDPTANQFLPTTGASVDQRIAAQAPLAQNLLAQLLKRRQ